MRKEPRKKMGPAQEEQQHKINNGISAREIRLVLEGEEPKVMPTSEALRLAEEQEMDLVEISPNATPPVCKIMDYRKFLYNQKRKEEKGRGKHRKIIGMKRKKKVEKKRENRGKKAEGVKRSKE